MGIFIIPLCSILFFYTGVLKGWPHKLVMRELSEMAQVMYLLPERDLVNGAVIPIPVDKALLLSSGLWEKHQAWAHLPWSVTGDRAHS